MNELIQCGQLKAEARRLLNYRFPLLLAILVNCVLVARVPLNQMRADSSGLRNVALMVDNALAAEGSHAVTTDACPLYSCQVDIFPGDELLFAANDSAATQATAPQQLWVDAPGNVATDTSNPLDIFIAVDTTPLDTPATEPAAWSTRLRSVVSDWGSAHLPTWLGSQAMATPGDEGEVNLALDIVIPPAEVSPLPSRAPMELMLRNPADNHGPVSFLVNGNVYSLLPGEAHGFRPADEYLVEFHPGKSFADVSLTLSGGVYTFVVTDTGWDLRPTTR